MPKAVWNGVTIAQAAPDEVEIVEGNVYFPQSAVRAEYLEPSETTTTCHWKGLASYYHVRAGGKRNPDAAWTYRNPLEAAKHVAGRIAFWRGVEVEREP